MNIIYEYTNVSASERLESLANDKLLSLSEKFPSLIRADVFFKKESTSEDENKHCGIRLSLPGPRLYASSETNSFENAISECSRELTAQLKKRKASQKMHA